MENEKLTRKQIIPIIVGVLTLVVLVASATYAYFSVTAGNSSGTTTITGDIGGDTIGSVTLTGGNTDLYLGISAYDMSETNKGKVYYSSTTEGSRETNVANAGKTTYTATLSGDNSGTTYACDYEFTITKTGTTPNSYLNALNLVFEGDIDKTLKFYVDAQNTQKINGTFVSISSSNPTKEFSAYLKLENTNSKQNNLAGTNLSVEIENTKWKCYLLEDLPGEAYALYTESNQTLTFLRSETPYSVGNTYNDTEITAVYTGFEEESYKGWDDIPWSNERYQITSVVFEDEIRPLSTANWFYDFGYNEDYNTKDVNMDITNLNTSLVADMSNMFAWGYADITGIENLNTSKVTNMSNMFNSAILKERMDLSAWDVSNVTNMSTMFFDEIALSQPRTLILNGWNTIKLESMNSMFQSQRLNIIGLETWDTSNVTDMSYMFRNFDSLNELNISGWDTSNVEDMSYMFDGFTINVDLNLSGWDVSNVTNHEYFSYVSGTGTLTPPIWPTNN